MHFLEKCRCSIYKIIKLCVQVKFFLVGWGEMGYHTYVLERMRAGNMRGLWRLLVRYFTKTDSNFLFFLPLASVVPLKSPDNYKNPYQLQILGYCLFLSFAKNQLL